MLLTKNYNKEIVVIIQLITLKLKPTITKQENNKFSHSFLKQGTQIISKIGKALKKILSHNLESTLTYEDTKLLTQHHIKGKTKFKH